MPNGRYAIGELVIATPSRRVCGGKCRLGGRVTPPRRCVLVTTAYNTHREDFLTPGQSRAARRLLGWSQTRLAKEAGLGLSTVYDLECQRRDVSAASVEKMRKALEAAGVEFTNGKQPGVRLG